MPVNPKHAEEYELPELPEGSSPQGYDHEYIERERLLGGQTNEDKPEGPSGLGEDGQEEHVGKGTKIDDLIARVCDHNPIMGRH
jgi:hypothetical protein